MAECTFCGHDVPGGGCNRSQAEDCPNMTAGRVDPADPPILDIDDDR